MAAKTIAIKERKFVALLSSRLKEDGHLIDEAELDTLFGDAISNLPDSDLKTGLKKRYNTHLKKLKTSILLCPSKLKGEPTTEKHQKFKFNFYHEDEVARTIENIKATKSVIEKNNLYKSLWSCYPLLKDSQKVLSSLEETDYIMLIEKYLQCTVGCFNKKNVLECLSFLLRIFSSECEACLSSNQRSKCKGLASIMQKSIVIINQRWQSCTNTSMSSTSSQGESFEDMMAAMLSLYTDMLLLSSVHEPDDNSPLEHLTSLLYVILGHSPEHCMDVLLQVTQPHERLLPILRCILERSRGQLTHTQYIKFICLARLSIQDGSKDAQASIYKIAESQRASSGFVTFLLQSNESLADRLRLKKNMALSEITPRLLGDVSDDDIDLLLDIAMEQTSKDSSDDVNNETEVEIEVTQGDQTIDNQLFFIDSSGGVDDTEDNEVEVEENKSMDALLNKQMKTIIKETQHDSDSEDDYHFEEMTPSDNTENLFEMDENNDKDEIFNFENQDISKPDERCSLENSSARSLRRSTRTYNKMGK